MNNLVKHDDVVVSIAQTAQIGTGCEFGNGVRIGEFCKIANNVKIGPNSVIQDRVEIQSDVRIGSCVVVEAEIKVSKKSLIRSGSIVARNVPPYAAIEGNPAIIVGYDSIERKIGKPETHKTNKLKIKGVEIVEFPLIKDLRGDLSVGEFEKNIPFIPKRYFLVFNVQSKEIRGEHAHKSCKQFLICVKGSCSVVVDDGSTREEILLDAPNIGVYLPELVWGIQYKYSSDAVLLVFASEYYDADDYIRDYEQYLKYLK